MHLPTVHAGRSRLLPAQGISPGSFSPFCGPFLPLLRGPFFCSHGALCLAFVGPFLLLSRGSFTCSQPTPSLPNLACPAAHHGSPSLRFAAIAPLRRHRSSSPPSLRFADANPASARCTLHASPPPPGCLRLGRCSSSWGARLPMASKWCLTACPGTLPTSWLT